jgi:formate hydrogenlyase transcriptional activator
MEQTADETSRLQACINDLISVLALPAMWTGQDSMQIVNTLLDVLVGILRLDFAYARLKGPVGEAPIEMVRLAQSRNLTTRPQEICQVLNPWLGDDPQKWPLLVPNPIGDGVLSIAALRLGLQDEIGVIVAGSQRADFPGETERLLLRVAANQAAIGLQEARLLSEQKRVATELDQRVAQRTRELAAANEELKQEITERQRAESLLSAEKRSLEMIAHGASLTDILEDLCRAIDAQAPNTISSVLLMDPDGQRLRPAAGSRVPTGWARAITPVTIGPCVGSCGTAAFLKKPVIVSDIASDPLWVAFRDVALSHGLRAAWSQPLISKNDQVLGTFCLYYPEVRSPNGSDLRLLEGAGHVAVIAIDGERAQAALKRAFEEIKKSEAQLREIVDAIPQTIVVLGPDGNTLYVNRAMLDYTGLTMDEVMATDFRARVFHPEEVERLRDERQKALSRGTPFENEQRVRRRDGQYRWFLIGYNPLRDEKGHIIRWYATGTDIDDRKQAEERVRRENLALREEIDRSSMFEEIVGSSEALRRVLAQVAKVAPTDSTVLILGETGTGKELIARAIHKRSHRSTRAFIRVNCAAIPPSLLASELFGHEKGAFTGALQRRLGRFEAADGGTIFLDEIGELPLETQSALLRVLQERELERVGSSQPISVDLRVLAASNRDLKAAVTTGTFRQDLFYRLNVFPIQMPALRERVDDIPLLVEYLIERYARRAAKKIRTIEGKTMALLQAYDWPGNIRELQNVIERAVVLCDGDTFSVDEAWLKRELSPGSTGRNMQERRLGRLDRDREKEMIEAALASSGGRISGPSGAASNLGIPRQTLESRIASLGISKHRFKSG